MRYLKGKKRKSENIYVLALPFKRCNDLASSSPNEFTSLIYFPPCGLGFTNFSPASECWPLIDSEQPLSLLIKAAL